MTDNEIIKALECCSVAGYKCEECPLRVNGLLDARCVLTLTNYALDLINRQKAEIERLQSHIQEGIDLAKQVPEMVAAAQAEAIKEFAKMLIDKSKKGIIHIGDLPDFVKEMVGENND